MDCWPCFFIALIVVGAACYLAYDFIHLMGRSK